MCVCRKWAPCWASLDTVHHSCSSLAFAGMGRTLASLASHHLIPALTISHQCDDFFHKEGTDSHELTNQILYSFCSRCCGPRSGRSNIMEEGCVLESVQGYGPPWQRRHGGRNMKQLITPLLQWKQWWGPCI